MRARRQLVRGAGTVDVTAGRVPVGAGLRRPPARTRQVVGRRRRRRCRDHPGRAAAAVVVGGDPVRCGVRAGRYSAAGRAGQPGQRALCRPVRRVCRRRACPGPGAAGAGRAVGQPARGCGPSPGRSPQRRRPAGPARRASRRPVGLTAARAGTHFPASVRPGRAGRALRWATGGWFLPDRNGGLHSLPRAPRTSGRFSRARKHRTCPPGRCRWKRGRGVILGGTAATRRRPTCAVRRMSTRSSSPPSRRTSGCAVPVMPAALAISTKWTDHHDTAYSRVTSAAERLRGETSCLSAPVFQ